MKKTMNSFKRSAHIAGLKLKKYSPQIMTVAGIAGAVTSTVMACKATTKLNEILDECNEAKNKVEMSHENKESKEYKKEVTITAVKNAGKIAKLYAPAIGVGVASTALILGSHGIMCKRNANMAAAYATLDSMYKSYRKNVVDTFGKEVDQDMRFGVRKEQMEVTTTDDDGKEKTTTKVVDVVDSVSQYSDYARFFDESIDGWTKDPEYNLMLLKGYENHANNLLVSRGYLFLNEVYDIIGIPKSKAGQCVGWIYDKDNPIGDNYIDFGIFNEKNERARAFVNGYENVFLLDFNVDGDILNSPLLKLWRA